jgi:hypothetical protein
MTSPHAPEMPTPARPDIKRLLSRFANKHYAMAADEHKEGASDSSVKKHYDEANEAENALIAAIDAQQAELDALKSALAQPAPVAAMREGLREAHNRFLNTYEIACHTSKPADWHAAALLAKQFECLIAPYLTPPPALNAAQQMIAWLGDPNSPVDTFDEVQKFWTEGEGFEDAVALAMMHNGKPLKPDVAPALNEEAVQACAEDCVSAADIGMGPGTEVTKRYEKRFAEIIRKHCLQSASWDKQVVHVLKTALRECDKQRQSLIEGVVHAEVSVSEFRDKYFDEDPNEGCNGSPEYEALNNLRAHLAGTCIDDNGEYMDRDQFKHLAAERKEGQTL